MKKTVLFLCLSIFVFVSSCFAEQTAVVETSSDVAQTGGSQTGGMAASDKEFILVFRSVDELNMLREEDRYSALESLFTAQKEYLETKYPVIVRRGFPALSHASGRGMFMIEVERNDVKEISSVVAALAQDALILSINPNFKITIMPPK